ncbi:MAG: hypothetical protein ACI9DK_002508 [Vicingaceae bacterium]|jgi:hypothetical protein
MILPQKIVLGNTNNTTVEIAVLNSGQVLEPGENLVSRNGFGVLLIKLLN